jgi:hypothetical protein
MAAVPIPTSDFEAVFAAAEPFPLESALARSLRVQLGDLTVPVASIPDLILLKRQSARPKDLEDIQALEAILAEEPSDG